MQCKNCGEVVEGNYCGQCGQSITVSRITVPTILRDLISVFLQIDRGFIHTVKQLSINPGNSIRLYLQGQRRAYFKPVSYVLILSTVYFLITKTVGAATRLDDFLIGFSNGASEKGGEEGLITQVEWFAENYAYTTLLLLPVFSLASYISFISFKTNYAEHLVLNAYITGQQAIIYSLFALVMFVGDFYYLEPIPLILAVLYTMWVFNGFFEQENRVLVVLRTLLTYLIYYILSGLVLIAVYVVSRLLSIIMP